MGNLLFHTVTLVTVLFFATHSAQAKDAYPSEFSKATEAYEQGLQKLANGDQLGAMRIFNQLLVKSPNYIPVRLHLISMNQAQGSLNEAERLIQDGLRLNKDSKELEASLKNIRRLKKIAKAKVNRRLREAIQAQSPAQADPDVSFSSMVPSDAPLASVARVNSSNQTATNTLDLAIDNPTLEAEITQPIDTIQPTNAIQVATNTQTILPQLQHNVSALPVEQVTSASEVPINQAIVALQAPFLPAASNTETHSVTEVTQTQQNTKTTIANQTKTEQVAALTEPSKNLKAATQEAAEVKKNKVKQVAKKTGNTIKASAKPKTKFATEKIPYSEVELLAIEYRKALDELKQGDVIEAKQTLNSILLRAPNYHPARIKLVQHYRKNQLDSEAELLLADGLAEDPTHPDYILQMADILLRKNDAQQALAYLIKMPVNYQDSKTYTTLLAMAYYQTDHFDLAAKYYSRLVNYESRNSRWWLGLALALDSAGQQKDAINGYQRVLKLGGLESEVLVYARQNLAELQAALEQDKK